MNQSCFIRKIDELGRLVIPIEIRNFLEINEKDSLEIFLKDGGIFIKKEKPSCILCHSTSHLKYFSKKYICEYCIKNLKEVDTNE